MYRSASSSPGLPHSQLTPLGANNWGTATTQASYLTGNGKGTNGKTRFKGAPPKFGQSLAKSSSAAAFTNQKRNNFGSNIIAFLNTNTTTPTNSSSRPSTTGHTLRNQLLDTAPTPNPNPFHNANPTLADSLLNSAQATQAAGLASPSPVQQHARRNSFDGYQPPDDDSTAPSAEEVSGPGHGGGVVPHPSAAYARPSTSQATTSSPLDPNNNAELRNEIKRLQLAMIDQFGGGTKNRKSVGGSQFRARQPTPDSGAQSAEVSGLRVAVKNLRSELKSLRMDNEELEVIAGDDRSARRVCEEQLRKQHGDCVNLKSELDRMRKLCESTQATVKVVKQAPAAVTASSNDDSMMKILEARLKDEKKQCEALRENKKQQSLLLKTTSEELKETEQRLEISTGRWEEERTRLYAEIDRWRQRSTDSQAALEANSQKSTKEKSKIEDKLRRLSKSAGEKTKKDLAAKENELKKLAEEAESLRGTSDKLKDLEREHGNERRKSLQAIGKADQLGLEMEKLKALIEQLTKERAAQQQIIADNAEQEFKIREDLVNMRQISDVQEGEIEKLRGEMARMMDGKGAVESSNKKAFEKVLAQLKAITEELKVSTGEKVALQNVLGEKVEEVHKFESQLRKERRNHKINIEQALNSIVRLCVVAPTVNVQMVDQMMSYKAPLPKEKIRHFVQDQVLPKFATIFQQTADGTSPDGKNLDTWLQSLLVDMQGTIEKHLSKVFSKG